MLRHLLSFRDFTSPSSSSLLSRLSFLIIVSLLTLRVYAIPVDNGVEGEPEIECGSTSITVNFNTRNPFEGHVYAKGLYDREECKNDDHGRQVAGIEIAFDTCNTARTRSLNPRGIYVSATIVISFHPQFVTKVDRAYRIQCFYMEAEKAVSNQLEVSDLTTAFQTQVVPMPICRYEILDGGPGGGPIQFARIGQQVYHKWTCDSETTDIFCAVVHSCTVDDGNGDLVQILNEEGCATDKFLLNNLEYPTDLMAGQEAHVYKYADRSQLFYQCQISVSVKEPQGECPRPDCAEPQGFGAPKLEGAIVKRNSTKITLFKRLLRKREAKKEDILDVRVELTTQDISLNDQSTISQGLGSSEIMIKDVCLSPVAFSVLLAAFFVLIIFSAISIFFSFRLKQK